MVRKVISTTKQSNLSGSFRLSSKEHGAVNYMRFKKRMNLEHIHQVLGRSLATIHRVTNLNTFERIDNRGQTDSEYSSRQIAFSHEKKTMQIRLKLWFNDIVDTIQEAFETPLVPLALIQSENSLAEEDEDPV